MPLQNHTRNGRIQRLHDKLNLYHSLNHNQCPTHKQKIQIPTPIIVHIKSYQIILYYYYFYSNIENNSQ